jgi:hypothetical protein
MHTLPKKKHMTSECKPTGTAIIPYMQMVSGKNSRLQAKKNQQHAKTGEGQFRKKCYLLYPV